MNTASYQQLIEQCRERNDEDILRLASSVEDLTQDAKNALTEEMRRRGLGENDLAPYRTQELKHRAKIEGTIAARERGFKWAKKLALIMLLAWGISVLASFALRRLGANRDDWYPIAVIAGVLSSGLGLSLWWLFHAWSRLLRAQDHLDQYR